MGIKAIVGAKLGTLTINKSTCTNPFEKNVFKGKSFEGSVLPFADLFEKIKPPTLEQAKPKKLEMVAGAVAGAINGFKTGFRARVTEPVVQFAHKVRENVALGIDKVKNVKNSLVELKNSMKERLVNVFEHLKPEEPVEEGGARILSLKHINEKAPVQDLRATWVAENEKLADVKEVA